MFDEPLEIYRGSPTVDLGFELSVVVSGNDVRKTISTDEVLIGELLYLVG